MEGVDRRREGSRDENTERARERNGTGERKDNAAAIKLSQLTPRIKRADRTLGSVTKLLEYFAPLFHPGQTEDKERDAARAETA